MFEKGWRLPVTEAGSPKNSELTQYRKGLRRIAYHFNTVADFSAAASEYLQEGNVSKKLQSWLEFGLRYHEVGLGACMTEFELPTDADELLRAPETLLGEERAQGGSSRTPRKLESGDVIAIVGVRTAREGAEFDCLVIVEGDDHDEENVRVGTIDSTTGFIRLKDGFQTGQSRTLTAEQTCTPKYLTA